MQSSNTLLYFNYLRFEDFSKIEPAVLVIP